MYMCVRVYGYQKKGEVKKRHASFGRKLTVFTFTSYPCLSTPYLSTPKSSHICISRSLNQNNT